MNIYEVIQNLYYLIASNEGRKWAGWIEQHFSFHCAAKCDGLLRKGPKSDPI